MGACVKMGNTGTGNVLRNRVLPVSKPDGKAAWLRRGETPLFPAFTIGAVINHGSHGQRFSAGEILEKAEACTQVCGLPPYSGLAWPPIGDFRCL